VTAVAQAIVVVFTNSVAILGDTLHDVAVNAADLAG
jgi:divalent metal cation (Fe/Co/Zn/Cd) transporter